MVIPRLRTKGCRSSHRQSGFRLLIGVMALVCVSSAGAADRVSDLLNLSLEELMQVRIDTASERPSTWREQPGIITVFTAEDMVAMGARTLLDVVQRIPGTSLGVDGRNSIGLMMRGNWTLEGKILVLLNDMPLNELLYGSWSPLPYMPISQLERVEVLRGPGSTKYGGSAQLAVIRLYTREHDTQGQVDYTQINQSGTDTGLLGFTDSIRTDNVATTITGSVNHGHWGRETWIDNVGERVDTADAATQGSTLALTTDIHEDTRAQLYLENFDIDAIQGFGTNDPRGTIALNRVLMSASHDAHLSDTWTLTPRVGYRSDDLLVKAPTEPTVFDMTARSITAGFDATYAYADSDSFTWGADYQYQNAVANKTTGPYFSLPTDRYFGDDDTQAYSSRSLYVNWDKALGNYRLALGGRASHHQYAGNALTPRLGLTRAEDNWHFKWLYGEAFREPNIETIHYGTDSESLKPERTVVHELEFGHRVLADGYLTLSVFDQQIKDSIIFSQDELNVFAYNNNPEMHTRGAELQYLYRVDGFSLQANYSIAQSNDNDLSLYDVQGRSGQYLGAPAEVANLWCSVDTPVQDLAAFAGLRYVGTRTAMQYDAVLVGGSGFPISQQTLDAELTFNAGLRYTFAGAAFTLGVDNLTNERQWMPQPYEGASTPFPYGSRSVWARAEWRW